MKCNNHNQNNLSMKCTDCNRYICQQCYPFHQKLNHFFLSTAQLSQQVRDLILSKIDKLKQHMQHLSSLLDFNQGIKVIDLCHAQILNYLNQIFQSLKKDYKTVVNNLWFTQNSQKIQKMEKHIQFLSGWDRVILKNPAKAIIFDMEGLINKEQEQQGLNFTLNNRNVKDFTIPQISYNELALRRVSESLSQTLCITRINGKKVQKQKHAKYMSKFLQGTNILYEYDVQSQNFKKISFRQFTVPTRCQSICIGKQIYLIGGHNKKQQPAKQIWIYQKSYNIMRIIALMKQGRVGHCLCASSNCITSQDGSCFSSNPDQFYIFGGKGVSTLQKVNVKTKALQFVSDFGRSIVGISGAQCNNCLYFFGGAFQPFQMNENVIKYDIQNDKWHQIIVLNSIFYTKCLNPIVTRVSQNQIIIMGGYKPFQETSYANIGMQVYNINGNYLSGIGKGQICGTLMSNGGNVDFIGGYIVGICNFKKSSKNHGPNLPIAFNYGIKQDKLEMNMFLPM